MPRVEKTLGYLLKPRALARIKRALERLLAKRQQCPDPRALDIIVKEIADAEQANEIKEVLPSD